MVVAVERRIGTARAVEEVRRVEHQEIEAGMAHREQLGRAAEQRLEPVDGLAAADLAHDVGIARQHRAHRDVVGGERTRQRARHVGEAARLDQREDLRGDRQDLDRHQ